MGRPTSVSQYADAMRRLWSLAAAFALAFSATVPASAATPGLQQIVIERDPAFRPNDRIEIALVIDNTGSMQADGRLDATRAAARTFVQRLEAFDARQVDDDAVRVALVPFSMTVRIHRGFASTGNRSGARALPWLSRSPDHTGSTGATGLFLTGQDRFELLDRVRIGWGGCIESRPYPHSVRDTAPSVADEATMFVPYFSPDAPDTDALWNGGWRGYMRSNDWINEPESALAPLAINPRARRVSSSAQVEAWMLLLRDPDKYQRSNVRAGIGPGLGPNQGCGLQPVVRLTDDFDAVLDGVDAMTASGNTDITLGLMWGWHAISPNRPFANGRPYGSARLRKIVILFTDGDNINSTFSSPDNSTYSGQGLIWQQRLGEDIGLASTAEQRAARMDERLLELCANMRGQNVELYTVGVQFSPRGQARLRDCAGSDDRVFHVESRDGIASAFDRIADAIGAPAARG